MIRVRVEMIPHGILASEQIAEIEIVNDLSHPDRPQFGNYRAKIFCNGEERNITVKNHCRIDGIIPLLASVCFGWGSR